MRSRLTVALIVVAVALIGLGSFWVTRGAPSSTATSPSISISGPTAVPTLDFFRGKSYPTPTPQGSP